MPVIYKNEKLDVDFRVYLLVQNEVMVELKAVKVLLPVHDAHLLTYMKLMDKRWRLLINFNVPKLIDGFHRKVLNF